MIHLPRRSVTRFFIPLIDVLLLLFCIFLLMPFVGEESAEAQAKKGEAEDQTEELERLRRQVQRQKEELAKLRELRDLRGALAEIERLRDQVKQLAQKRLQYLQHNARILDIDGKTGEIGYYDHEARKRIPIDSEKSAHELIQRLRQSAGEKDLLFLLVYPREDSGYPILKQEDAYKRWFAKTNYAFVGRD